MSSVHIDHEAIVTLKEVMEDEFQLLIDTFLSDSEERLEALREGVSALDADAVRRAAHSFKGSSSNIGAPQLAEICFKMEEAGRTNQLDNLPRLLAEAEAEFAVVKQEIDAL